MKDLESWIVGKTIDYSERNWQYCPKVLHPEVSILRTNLVTAVDDELIDLGTDPIEEFPQRRSFTIDNNLANIGLLGGAVIPLCYLSHVRFYELSEHYLAAGQRDTADYFAQFATGPLLIGMGACLSLGRYISDYWDSRKKS